MQILWFARRLALGAAGLAVGLAARRVLAPPRTSRALPPQANDTGVLAETIAALARAIEAKTQSASGDVRRVRAFATSLASRIGMSPADVEAVAFAAILHDIGTLAVPPHILAKPGPLTAEEFDKVRMHPTVGAEILADIRFAVPVTPLILAHHERWDGRGYPHGLGGAAIPLGARVIAIADCFDSLTNARPYREPFAHDAAIDVLRHEAGLSLDPHLVEDFIALLPAFERSETRAAETATPEGGVAVLENIAAAHREFAALFDVSQAISTTLGVEDTSRALVNHLRQLVPHDACAVFLPREDGAMHVAYGGGVDADVLRDLVCPRGHGLAARAIGAACPLVNADPSDDLRAGGITQPIALASAIVMPLFASYRAVGALALYATRPNAFTDDHARLLDYVSSQAASALGNAVRYEQAHTASLTDALTGLPNSRFLAMHLTQELARAARQGSDLALLLIDLDDFKQINDSVGHHIGDRALRAVARILQTSVRAYDVSARYAGDEFVVMLPECGVDGVEDRRFEIAHLLNTLSVPADDGRRIAVRASVGAAVFPARWRHVRGTARRRRCPDVRQQGARQGRHDDRRAAGDIRPPQRVSEAALVGVQSPWRGRSEPARRTPH